MVDRCGVSCWFVPVEQGTDHQPVLKALGFQQHCGGGDRHHSIDLGPLEGAAGDDSRLFSGQFAGGDESSFAGSQRPDPTFLASSSRIQSSALVIGYLTQVDGTTFTAPA